MPELKSKLQSDRYSLTCMVRTADGSVLYPLTVDYGPDLVRPRWKKYSLHGIDCRTGGIVTDAAECRLLANLNHIYTAPENRRLGFVTLDVPIHLGEQVHAYVFTGEEPDLTGCYKPDSDVTFDDDGLPVVTLYESWIRGGVIAQLLGAIARKDGSEAERDITSYGEWQQYIAVLRDGLRALFADDDASAAADGLLPLTGSSVLRQFITPLRYDEQAYLKAADTVGALATKTALWEQAMRLRSGVERLLGSVGTPVNTSTGRLVVRHASERPQEEMS